MPRDCFALIRMSQGYASPAGRPGCHSCCYGSEIHGRERRAATDPMSCTLGSFFVHPWATCNRYQPRAAVARQPEERTA